MYRKKTRIHFVGIGGIGMSGIATILRSQGYPISGCDSDLDQSSVKNLIALGCEVHAGNYTPACQEQNYDILVYSSAIRPDNPEIQAAQARGIPTISRALMLAELMRTKYSVAIAGSHGKTTTTSLISHILIEAECDPTVIIGGHLKTISTNARIGKGDFLIAEADESDRSLLHLHATLAVVTNIDLEHLETYKDLDDIKQTFAQFLSSLPFYGKAILCIDDANIQSLLPMPHIKTILYGMSPRADLYATDVQLHPDHSEYTLMDKDLGALTSINLNMPGKHNVLNSLAAIAVTRDLGVSLNSIKEALATFKGVERRFSYHGIFKGAEIFDDYGHHPKEIEQTLLVAYRRSKGKLTVLFQPHRYTRTHHLWQDFVDIFANSNIDNLVITDVYPASENPIPGVTGKQLAQSIIARNPHCKVTYIPLENDFQPFQDYVAETVHEGDLVLLLGAGKMNKLAKYLV